MSHESDRRQEERAAIDLKVEYQRLNTFFHDYTKNISKGGTFIKTGKPLDVGTLFVFKLYVPTMPEPVVLKGEVRWIVKEGEALAGERAGHEPGMGIRFVYEDESEREEVEQMVEKVMVRSLGQLIYSHLKKNR